MHTYSNKVGIPELFDNGFSHFSMGNFGIFQKHAAEFQTPHKNDFYTILLIDNAVGIVQIDNCSIRLEDVKIVIIEPGCVNSIAIKGNAAGTMICFSEDFFALRYHNHVLNQFGFLEKEIRAVTHLSETQSVKIACLVQWMEAEFLLQSSDSSTVLRSYINIFLFELERLFLPEITVKKADLKFDKIQQFKRLISEHYKTNKLPSFYASLLNITTNYLNKLCKLETGKTAGDLIRKYLIIESQRLLRFTDFSVNEIADELGFENTSYFITFFKKQMGITPEQFRKNK